MTHFAIGIITAIVIAAFSLPAAADAQGKAISERVLLIHPVSLPDDDRNEAASQGSVYDGLAEQLTDRGYRLVDKASAELGSRQIAATHDIDPLLNKAASYGLKFLAEYTLFFKTWTITKDNDNGIGALVKVTAKLVDNTSSLIITSRTAEASSTGLTLEDAVDKAGRAGGKKLAAAIAGVMKKIDQDSDRQGRIYTIVMEDTGGDRSFPSLLTRLESNRSVSAVKETETGGGKTTFEVYYRGKRDQLDRDLLKTADELGLKIQKVRSEGNRSTWKTK